MEMSEYILITEHALDYILINTGFFDGYSLNPTADLYKQSTSNSVDLYYTSNEPKSPYCALIRRSAIASLASTDSNPEDAYRRIARVVKEMKTPPIHLPRQWSEYHHKNLLAFFALQKSASRRRWIADLNSTINCVRFDQITSNGSEIDLARYTPSPWPEGVAEIIRDIPAKKSVAADAFSASALAAEVDLQAIGSTSVVNNRTYEEWERYLTGSQREILSQPVDRPIRIIGPAGSGKTLALCMRALKVSRDPEVRPKGKKILVATHSWAMAERIDGVIQVLNGGRIPAEITTLPLLSLLEIHAGHIGQQRTDVIGDDSSDGRFKSLEIIKKLISTIDKTNKSGISDWISNALQADEDSRARLDLIINLYDEISGVLTASGVAPDDPDSIRKYINDTREDWMPPFANAPDRGFVISIYRGFIQELIDRSSITTDQFVLDSIRVLETFTWRMRKETDGYDYIFVDELQLFDPQERSALELLGRSKKGVPFVTAEDPSQGVFSALNSRTGIAQNDPIYLETVHRFNKGIFDFIGYIYQKFPLNTIPLKVESPKTDKSERPKFYTCQDDYSAISKASELADTLSSLSSPSDRICLVTLGDIDGTLANILEERKLLVTRLTSFDDVEQLAYSKKSLIVAPWQFIGGTQFSHVIVVAAAINQPSSQFGKLRELISVYLSCSRAAHSLSLVCSSYTPSVVWEAKEHGLLEHEVVS